MESESVRLFHSLIVATKSAVRFVWSSPDLVGMTGPQFAVLKILQTKGPMTPTELSDFLFVTAGNVTGIISRLKKLGFIERRRLSSDRRCLRIAIAEKGISKLETIIPYWKSAVESCFDSLSKSDRKELFNLLEKFNGIFPHFNCRKEHP